VSEIIVLIDRTDRAGRVAAVVERAGFKPVVASHTGTAEFLAAWRRAAGIVTDLTPPVLRSLVVEGKPLLGGTVPVILLCSPGHAGRVRQELDSASVVVEWDDCLNESAQSLGETIARLCTSGRGPVQGRLSVHRARIDPPAAQPAAYSYQRRRLQRREQLLSGLAHDLRTPLTAVREFADLLEQEAANVLSEQQRHYVEVIQRRCVDAARMLDNLLDVLRIQSGRLRLYRRAIQLQHVVDEVREGFEAALRHHQVKLEEFVPDDFPPVFADHDLLVRILSNLLNNALRFSPPGGRIAVAAELATVDLVRVSVRDEGPGIEPAELRRIFRSYVQGSGSRAGGYGLGLAIVRQLVRYHGGRVSVESKLGRGSTFAFTLPLFVPLAIVRRYLRSVERSGQGCVLSCWGFALPSGLKFDPTHRLICSLVPAQDLVLPDQTHRTLLLLSRSRRPQQLIERISREIAACGCGQLAIYQLDRSHLEPWLRAPRHLADSLGTVTADAQHEERAPASLTG